MLTPSLTAPAGLRPKPCPVCLKRPAPAGICLTAMTPALTASTGLRPKPSPVCLKPLAPGGVCPLTTDRNDSAAHRSYGLPAQTHPEFLSNGLRRHRLSEDRRPKTANSANGAPPPMPLPHISVCICTYQRPEMLLRLLRALEPQEHHNQFTWSVVVADNDRAGSARATVESFRAGSPLEVIYCTQPERNIALTRNAAIAHATGELIAFIDDDEFPVTEWLLRLYETLVSGKAAAVLGPVRPHFETPPPAWVIQGRFCERPECPTGTALPWQNCRTGNVLFRCSILPAGEPPFREAFGTGGEDKDFFRRLAAAGHTFVWCNEAIVSESVPASRLTRKYMLQRALLRGKNSLRLTNNRPASLAKSVVAVPAYSLLLPLALIQGPDRFMHTLIPLCDHAGKLLALVGLNPITERSM